MAHAALGHHAHQVGGGGIRVAGDDRRGHDVAHGVLQRAGTVGVDRPGDVALGDDAGDLAAVIADDHGSDPVLGQQCQ